MLTQLTTLFFLKYTQLNSLLRHVLAHLLVKTEELQQLDAQQQADLIGLLGDVQVTFQVTARQGVQQTSIHKVGVKGLRVLRQSNVT